LLFKHQNTNTTLSLIFYLLQNTRKQKPKDATIFDIKTLM